jgi:hypothetical protein
MNNVGSFQSDEFDNHDVTGETGLDSSHSQPLNQKLDNHFVAAGNGAGFFLRNHRTRYNN